MRETLSVPEIDADGQRQGKSRANWLTIPGYTLLRELGHGGMGVVYKARQLSLDRPVALKMVLTRMHARPDVVARFRLEAKAVAQLQHPNIVQIYEVGEHEGLPYLTLEFVKGMTLDKRLAGDPQPVRAAARLVEILARAVAHAHQSGIVHRDLKPANILLAVSDTQSQPSKSDNADLASIYGVPKISDFGLAKQLEDDDDSDREHEGLVMGTPSYLAPEQARGASSEIGPGVDIYALGVILYEMLTGRPPFKGATAQETIQQVATQEPVWPRTLQPNIPRDLETICLKCLNKDSRKRYPVALALADDLRRFIHGEPIEARPHGMVERLGGWCRRYPVPASLLAAMVCCLVFGTGYLSSLTDALVHASALESAALQSQILLEVNNSYSDVVKRAKAGKLTVTHEYMGDPAAIPIPATFTIELGQQISDRSESGVQIRLYSEYPFKSRRNGGPRDEFESDALQKLRINPAIPVYQFADFKGRPALRYATARLMQQTCVDCHNSHPDSPKKDWKVGELRGAVEIIQPLDKDVERTRNGLRGAFLFIGAICTSLLCLSGVALFFGKGSTDRRA